jgi:Flp pilus assembly protein TadG
MRRVAGRHDRREGQALVEFALVFLPFLFLLMGVVDLGRGIATNNGVANAAREIARVTSVHPGSPLGNSTETLSVIAVQRNSVLGLADPSSSIAITCTNMAGTSVPAAACASGDYVRVEVRVPFAVLTPLLGMVAPTTLSSVSHVQIP